MPWQKSIEKCPVLDLLRRLFGGESSGVHSVGDALNIELGPRGQAMRDAVAVINRVHQDGRLPIIPVTHASFRDRHGQFSLHGTDIAIQINLVGPQVELSTVHEVGHFLDHSGLGRPHQFASENHGVLDRWRTAVRQSRNIARLAPLLGAGTGAAETLPGGTMVEYGVDQDYLHYLLQPRELWARSYAQFITVKSDDPKLRRQLAGLQERPAQMFYYGEQWDGDDFLPILASIEAIFRDLGWM